MSITKMLPWTEALYPKFRHDCGHCKFITGLLIRGERHDLYICVDDRTGSGSVVYRYGDDGPEYSSFCTEFITQSLGDSARGEWGELALELASIIHSAPCYPVEGDVPFSKPKLDVRLFSDSRIDGTADPLNVLQAKQNRILDALQFMLTEDT